MRWRCGNLSPPPLFTQPQIVPPLPPKSCWKEPQGAVGKEGLVWAPLHSHLGYKTVWQR